MTPSTPAAPRPSVVVEEVGAPIDLEAWAADYVELALAIDRRRGGTAPEGERSMGPATSIPLRRSS